MPRPNTKFELSVDDLAMIEDALRSHKKSLSGELVAAQGADVEIKETLLDVHDLLGRLHNQKEFYRPKSGPYLGG